MTTLRTHILPALVLPFVLIAVAALYGPAQTGGFQFDDQQNLSALEHVTDSESAFRFIFSGHAGPSGRPIALASFALQSYAWPDRPGEFLRVNILLHILNGALLTWCLLWLGRLRSVSSRETIHVAIMSATLWLVIPLLASSSLFIVQRMATLSATFVLSGLLGYLASRSRLSKNSKWPIAGMSLSLILGTGLATLTKENGALLPILVLALECTLLGGRLFQKSLITRLWGWIFLIVPLAGLLFLLATHIPYSEHTLSRREFTAWQRLWTEAEILWQYLFHAFIPLPSQLVPFHDNIKASPSLFQFSTFAATIGWISITGLALFFRKTRPLLSFAVFWYLSAHLLESTVIGLELYFSHRNYIALIGPVYSLVASTWTMRLCSKKITRPLLIGYTILLAASLYSLTSLWGQPALAAEMWAIHKPNSTRANIHLATHLQRQQYHSAALRTLKQTYNHDPQNRTIAGIETLKLGCAMHPDRDHANLANQLLGSKRIRFDPAFPKSLIELQRLLLKQPCTGVNPEMIEQLAIRALQKPAYANERVAMHNLYSVLTERAIADRDFSGTMTYIEKTLRVNPSLEGLQLALDVLIDAGRTDLGADMIAIVRGDLPTHPIKRRIWIDKIEQYERQLRQLSNKERSPSKDKET